MFCAPAFSALCDSDIYSDYYSAVVIGTCYCLGRTRMRVCVYSLRLACVYGRKGFCSGLYSGRVSVFLRTRWATQHKSCNRLADWVTVRISQASGLGLKPGLGNYCNVLFPEFPFHIHHIQQPIVSCIECNAKCKQGHKGRGVSAPSCGSFVWCYHACPSLKNSYNSSAL